MFHRSQRLFLRPPFSEDWEAVLARLADDEGALRNLARAPWPYDANAARAFVSMPQDPRFPHFLVTLPGSGVIGSAGLASRDGDAELGYWIGRGFRGQGFATEAAGAVLQIARTLGHRRIVAGHFADNPASGGVLRKLGFAPTGRIGKRYSCARGEMADAVEYELDLAAVPAAIGVREAA